MKDKLKHIPFLGSGIGYRSELKSFIYLNRDKIDFLEIIAEHYIDVPDAKMRELEILKQHFTIIPHAINLSLGSARGIDLAYLKKLEKLIRFVDPPYWSEHISYTQAHGGDVGHLSPIIYNSRFLELMTRNIETVRSFIPYPLILENITYHVELPGKEYTDADFLNKLCDQNDCGLLLDLTNLFINSRNFNFDPAIFLKELELSSVVQLHYVGYAQHENIFTDTHSKKTQEDIFKLMESLLKQHTPNGILLERDENLEATDEISSDLLLVKDLLAKYRHAVR